MQCFSIVVDNESGPDQSRSTLVWFVGKQGWILAEGRKEPCLGKGWCLGTLTALHLDKSCKVFEGEAAGCGKRSLTLPPSEPSQNKKKKSRSRYFYKR